MHPLLGHRQRMLPYLGAWVPLGALLAAALALTGPAPWSEAAVLAAPLSLTLAFICLASFYPCRAVPLVPFRPGRLLLTHTAATLVSVGVWMLLAVNLAIALGQTKRFAGAEVRFVRQAPILFGLGCLLYLLATAGHYLILSFQQAQERERETLEAALAARDAELKALRAQVNPHFLFNALNSVSALVASDPRAAREMCLRLASFLRASLRMGGSEEIPLHEELALAREYLAIEQVRFGERLGVEVDADGASDACLVPPLLLQPLVENAVTHGISQRLEGGTVSVTARRRDPWLHLTVENPYDRTVRRSGGGTGLDNVRRRLEGRFGDRGRLQVRPGDEVFLVECVLPACSPGASGEVAAAPEPGEPS